MTPCAGWSLVALLGFGSAGMSPLQAQTQSPATKAGTSQTPNAIVTSYIERARAQGDAGFADSALTTLASIRRDHPEIPEATVLNRTSLEALRYRLVGQKGIAIAADYTLNWPPSDLPGPTPPPLRLIQFTAHWCGPCQTSYPALSAIAKEFGSRVEIVLVTELYGQFDGKPAKPEVELKADSSYYAKVAPQFPVAISRQPPPPVVPGDYASENVRRYFVGPLPQLVLIDGRNVIRRIFVGGAYQETNALRAAIMALLQER